MSIIPAVVTVDAKAYWSQFFGGLLGDPSTTTSIGVSFDPVIKSFKVGMGGWIDRGAGPVARSPDPTLRRVDNSIQDIDAIVDGTRSPPSAQRYPSTGRASFEKTLTGGDFTFESPGTLRVQCFLDFSEFNDDGFGNPPQIYECGLFSDHPTVAGQKLMVAYATFPLETKDISKQLTNILRIQFGP